MENSLSNSFAIFIKAIILYLYINQSGASMKKNQRLLTVALDKPDYKAMEKEAKNRGISMTGLVRIQAKGYSAKHKRAKA